MATPQTQLEPNLFELSGHHTHITYSTSGIDGKPHFSFRNQHFNKAFTGQEIRTEDSELGKLVTVSLMVTIDTGATTATLLIPSIAMGSQQSQPLHTFCIISVHSGPIAPGHQGQGQTYEAVELNGSARHVQF